MNNEEKSGKIIKAGLGYTIGNYLLKGLSFLSVPIFARLLSTEDFGEYNTFVAYEGILFVLIGFAIHSSYKNAKYRYIDDIGYNGYKTYISNTMLLITVSGIIWFLLFIFLSPILSNLLGLEIPALPLLILYSYSSAILVCYNTDVGLRYQYKSFLTISGVNAISNIVLSVLLIITVFSNKKYYGRMLGTVIPIFCIAVFVIIHYLLQAKPNNTKSMLKWGLKYSIPIIPHGISQIVLTSFDRIMITNMIGKGESGVYSFAYTVYSILAVTKTSLDTVWTTWFYEKMNSKKYIEIKRYSTYYVILIYLLSTMLMLISPEIIIILGGEKYSESIYSVLPIVAGGFFAFLYNLPAGVEYFHEKTKFIAIGTTSAAIINIFLNYYFIKSYGYIAAAYTTLVTYILYFLFHYILARKIDKNVFFSVKTFSICSLLIILQVFLIQRAIPYFLIRLLLFFLVVIAAIVLGEKNYQYIVR